MTVGDRVRVVSSSIFSMVLYGDKGKIYSCPCHWKGRVATVIAVQGNYAKLLDDNSDWTILHLQDLMLSRDLQEDD